MLFLFVLLLGQQRVSEPDPLKLHSQAPVPAESSATGMRVLRGAKALEAPRIDGRLDDPVWATTPGGRR